MHEAVQGHSALAAGRDRVDGELRTGDHVAAGKDVGLRGSIRHTVDLTVPLRLKAIASGAI